MVCGILALDLCDQCFGSDPLLVVEVLEENSAPALGYSSKKFWNILKPFNKGRNL